MQTRSELSDSLRFQTIDSSRPMRHVTFASPAERQRLGRNARHLALSTYEFGIIAAKWLDLYGRCLSNAKQRARS